MCMPGRGLSSPWQKSRRPQIWGQARDCLLGSHGVTRSLGDGNVEPVPDFHERPGFDSYYSGGGVITALSYNMASTKGLRD